MVFWIARNSGKWGGLYLYSEKPYRKIDGSFAPMVGDPFYWQLNSDEYPEVTCENSPQKFELKLVNDL